MKVKSSFCALLLLTSLRLHALEPQAIPGPLIEGPQFVRADRAGNVYFLKVSSFEVYPVLKNGALGEPVRLQARSVSAGLVRDAALSPSGDRWILMGESSVRLFVDGKEQVIPSPDWKPWSLAMVRETPFLAVLPLPMGGKSVNLKRIGPPAWILQLGSDRWETMSELKGVTVAEFLEGEKMNEVIARNSVVLMGDHLGRLWAARQYGYRVQRFNASGQRADLEITVDFGGIRDKKKTKGIPVDLHGKGENPTDATRSAAQEKGTYYPFTAERVIYSLTEGRDGKVYFLVDAEGGSTALDRYDPTRGVLERLPTPAIKLTGINSMAAGKAGLYIAAWEKGGRWLLPWDQLEGAKWKPVDGVEINALPASPSRD